MSNSSRPGGTDMGDQRPGERRSLSFLAGAGWTFALSLTLGFVVQLCEEARPGASSDLVTFTTAYVVIHLLALFVLLRVYEPSSSIRDAIGLRKTSILAMVLAVPLGAGAYPTMDLLDDLVARKFPLSEDETALLGKLLSTPTVGHRVFLVASLVFLLPLAEDVFFRGFLFGGLKKGKTVMLAVLGTALYYALAQGDARSLPSAFAIGLTLAWLRAQTGSLLPAMLAHAAYAAVPVVHLLHGQDPSHDEYPRAVLLGGAALTIVCALVVQVVAAKGARATVARLADG